MSAQEMTDSEEEEEEIVKGKSKRGGKTSVTTAMVKLWTKRFKVFLFCVQTFYKRF